MGGELYGIHCLQGKSDGQSNLLRSLTPNNLLLNFRSYSDGWLNQGFTFETNQALR